MRPSRREFLGASAATLALPWLPGCGAETPPPPDFSLPRAWTWAHGNADRTPDEWAARFRSLRASGLEGVLASGGDTAMLSDAARGVGLAFHRWMWTLNRSGDRAVKDEHPDWFTVSRNGDPSLTSPPYVGYYQWLCPTKPAVRAYLRTVVDELAASPDVDGVHLDYIRHSDVILPVGLWDRYGLVQDHEMAEFDFCYCDTCREVFAGETGRDPMAFDDPSADAEWRAFRWRTVTELVAELAEAAHARNQPITAAVFPTPAIARRLVRQAWDDWPLDAVFPMLYHRFYNENPDWIGRSVTEGVTALSDGRGLYAGLYLPDLSPDALGSAVRIALDAGAAGISTFEMNGLSDAHLAALASSLAVARSRAEQPTGN
jgi:uncharacterized lipoprotein YddW (UPF0748 family)